MKERNLGDGSGCGGLGSGGCGTGARKEMCNSIFTSFSAAPRIIIRAPSLAALFRVFGVVEAWRGCGASSARTTRQPLHQGTPTNWTTPSACKCLHLRFKVPTVGGELRGCSARRGNTTTARSRPVRGRQEGGDRQDLRGVGAGWCHSREGMGSWRRLPSQGATRRWVPDLI